MPTVFSPLAAETSVPAASSGESSPEVTQPYEPSDNKKKYLDDVKKKVASNPKWQPNDQMTVAELTIRAAQTSTKHHFPIDVNGGPAHLQQVQQAWLKEKQAPYLSQDRYFNAHGEIDWESMHELPAEQRSRMANFFHYPSGADPEQIVAMEEAKDRELSEMLSNDATLREVFTRHIDTKLSELEEQSKDIGPSIEQYVPHIQDARKAAAQTKDAKFSAKFYAGKSIFPAFPGEARGLSHVETAVITPRGDLVNIIPFPKPIGFDRRHFPDIFTSQLGQFLSFKRHATMSKEEYEAKVPAERRKKDAVDGLYPLATGSECVSLGRAYSKDCLKNNAYQMRNFSLLVELDPADAASHGGSAQPIRFFLPPPQPLKCSHSALHIDVMRTILTSDKPIVEIVHKDRVYEVRTLRWMQQNGARLRDMDGREMSEKDLQALRKKWVKELNRHALPRRDSMKLRLRNNDGRETLLNTYPQYLAHKDVAKVRQKKDS